MATRVVLPKSGMGIEEGTILRWLKAVGERVEKGERLVEVETAKAVQEVEALTTGVLAAILVEEGQTAVVNSAIAVIEEDR